MKKIYFLLLAFYFLNTINAQIINFPDANFKAKLLSAGPNNYIAKNISGVFFKIDQNNDGEIQIGEALLVDYLVVSNNGALISSKISNLVGIEYFTNLTHLDCGYNRLTSFNVNYNTALFFLYCNNNQLTSLNVTLLTHIKSLHCQHNFLTNLNLNDLNNLQVVFSNDNNLTNISFLNCVNFLQFQCQNNNLTQLDLGGTAITSLDCTNNPNLSYVNVKNGLVTTIQNIDPPLPRPFSFGLLPNLKYVCFDEGEEFAIQNSSIDPSIPLTVYCSFSPGSKINIIKGNIRLDLNNNGCDNTDNEYDNVRIKIVNANGVESYTYTDSDGNYILYTNLLGNISTTPVPENSYFVATPNFHTFNFTSFGNTQVGNFCITENGFNPDLSISFIPLDIPRPGFDANYKLVYKNSGTGVQSGNVTLNFNDNIIDLILANPACSNQSLNTLLWTFTNLQPGETRNIDLRFNLNSPTETPPLNSGNILLYTGTINSTSQSVERTPNDNICKLYQTVVNSYDPNDKTCLEGNTIPPNKVGDYVHYMIRFENNGTANAQNVVIKDMIDLNKFEINTLIPIKGSHDFVTNITSGNKVEFIFQNINLPFADATNDGYVAFKIKTKSTLVIGNTFSNSASIYFDYNFPIVTNTATTTIAVLSKQDFEFSNFFTVYPNPVFDVLNISKKDTIEVTSINIYNTLGQLVLVIPNAQNTKTVDVSSLIMGNYFIKINSDKGTSNTKFIKN